MNALLDLHPEVAAALAARQPVVALESTIIAHGMPYPQNVATALQVEADALLLHIEAVLARATLNMPDYAGHQKGGKLGLHTEHLSHMLAPMQVLQRTHLGAQW